MPEQNAAIVIEKLEKSYPTGFGGKKLLVLNDVSFKAKEGEVTVLMGQSGCGKSTLFRILIGDETSDAGQVEILKENISSMRKMQEVKKKFGILFQQSALFNSMSVGDNIAFPIFEHQPQLHPKIVDIMVDTKLRQVELDPSMFKRKMPSNLSGGEKKRVGIARALALDPQLIFYDEPSAGLDPIVSRTIDRLIKDLVKVLGISSLVVTHELDSAFTIADRMILLKRSVKEHGDDWQGTIVYDQGNAKELRNSKKPYTVEFLGEYSHYMLCKKCRTVRDRGQEHCDNCQSR